MVSVVQLKPLSVESICADVVHVNISGDINSDSGDDSSLNIHCEVVSDKTILAENAIMHLIQC